VQKHPGGTRQRWEIITNFMNQQLAPQEPFTKEECLQQYQLLRSQKGTPRTIAVAGPSSGGVSTGAPPLVNESKLGREGGLSSLRKEQEKVKSEELWTNEQQKQLESGLARYPASLGLSQSERWKAIAELVEVDSPLTSPCPLISSQNKTPTECVRRYKDIRDSLKVSFPPPRSFLTSLSLSPPLCLSVCLSLSLSLCR
jgi:hypothetical protein